MARLQQRIEQFAIIEAGRAVALGQIGTARAAAPGAFGCVAEAQAGAHGSGHLGGLRPGGVGRQRHGTLATGRLTQSGQSAAQAVIHQFFNHVPRIVPALYVPEGQCAVQECKDGYGWWRGLDGVGQPFHFLHRAQRAEQRAGDGRFSI